MSDRPFNGGFGRELGREESHLEESVYCVECGTIFVPAPERDCPACTLAERLDRVERDLDIIDGGI